MPFRAVAAQALADWRAARARMDAAIAHSPEWEAAHADGARAREAYQDAFEAAQARHVPGPPSFSDATADDEPETALTPSKTDGQLYGG